MDSLVDRAVLGADRVLRVVAGEISARRPSPANGVPDAAALPAREKRRAASLMRVNHAGEVCAQALYEGQGLTARRPATRRLLSRAASEELDHLAWCAGRLRELEARPSVLNPLWYAAAFTLGAVAGVAGDRVSLGFVHATEEGVVDHLDSHAERLPEADTRSRVIVEQMRHDEAEHGAGALEAGGMPFSRRVRRAMALGSGVMTRTAYRL